MTGGLGWLKNGNPPCDPRTVRRCGARNRAGRCMFHGGKSSGPRTEEGRERIRRARWKHGRKSAAAIAARREDARVRREIRQLVAMLSGAR